MEAAARTIELADVEFGGLLAPDMQPLAGAWSLAPLASTNGTIRAEIVDAHLGFDAHVTVPMREGRIDFKDATVEHVGPDSRMGVSPQGIYVDAPNGRSYVYQFQSPPAAGVTFEQRSALPLPWASRRGSIELQPFVQALMQQAPAAHVQGVTSQSRQLFDRTALSGEVRLGDGRIAAPGVQADLVDRARGHNTIRIHSEAVGRGLALEIDPLHVRNVMLQAGPGKIVCGDVTASVSLRLFVDKGQLRFTVLLRKVVASGLRLSQP